MELPADVCLVQHSCNLLWGQKAHHSQKLLLLKGSPCSLTSDWVEITQMQIEYQCSDLLWGCLHHTFESELLLNNRAFEWCQLEGMKDVLICGPVPGAFFESDSFPMLDLCGTQQLCTLLRTRTVA